MALITTPGAPDADSYVTLAEADAYHAGLGNTGWVGADDVKQGALRRALQYVDTQYRYRGERVDAGQSLEWPRTGFDGIPQRLKDAQCEAALRALTGKLYADSDGRVVTAKTVGPLKTEYAQVATARFPVIDALLRGLVAGTGQAKLVRG